MGKVSKAKTKTKKKLKEKMKKITEKAKGVIGKAAPAATAALAVCLLPGCASTGQQPARSQSMCNRFEHCLIWVAGAATNESRTVELFTQTQANEGSESVAPVATPTNTTTTDLRAQIPAGGSGGAGLVDLLLRAFGGGAKAEPKAGCPGGDCPKGGDCPECRE